MKRIHKYKFLTEEMKSILDEEIKKDGRDVVYDRIVHNIETQVISEIQQEPNAFEMVGWKCGEPAIPRYKLNYHLGRKNPLCYIDLGNLEQEMLYYINKKRLLDPLYEKDN